MNKLGPFDMFRETKSFVDLQRRFSRSVVFLTILYGLILLTVALFQFIRIRQGMPAHRTVCLGIRIFATAAFFPSGMWTVRQYDGRRAALGRGRWAETRRRRLA